MHLKFYSPLNSNWLICSLYGHYYQILIKKRTDGHGHLMLIYELTQRINRKQIYVSDSVLVFVLGTSIS